MIHNPGTVWINGSGVHHDSRTCAGQNAVPAFEEFVAGVGTEPCGLCQPNELVACDECGEQYSGPEWLNRHRFQDHMRGAAEAETPEGDDSWKQLEAKARGESDD